MSVSMDKDEVLHKMSKKIAQLTKVIFHLNTKQDESDLQLRAVTNAYELEIGAIVKDANVRVERAQTQVEQAKSKSAIKQVEALAEQYEREKRLATQDMATFREQMSEREQRNVKLWTDKMQEQLTQVKDLRGKCSEQKNVLGCRTKEFEAVHDEDAAKIRQFEIECADMRCTIEQEIQRREAAEKSFEELNHQLRSTSNEMGGVEKALNDMRVKYNDDISQMHKIEAELRHTVSSRDASIAMQNEQVLNLEKAKRDLHDNIAALMESNGDLAASSKELTARNEELVGRNDDLQNAMQRKLADVEDLDAKLKAAHLQADQAKRQWNMQLDTLNSKMSLNQEEHATLIVAQRDRLRKEVDAALLEANQVRQEKDILFADLESVRHHLDEVKKNLGLSLEANKVLEEETENMRQTAEILKAQYQTEMETLRATFRLTEEELLAEARSREEALLYSKDADLGKNQQETAAQIAQVQKELTDTADALARARSSHEADVDRLQSEVTRLTQLVDETHQSLSERGAEMDSVRAVEAQLRDALAESQALCAEQEGSSRAAIEGLQRDLESARAQFLEKEQEVKKELFKGIKCEETIKKLEGEIDALEQNVKAMKADFDTEKARYGKLAEAGGSDTARLTRENTNLRKSLEDMKEEKKQVDDKLIEQHNETLGVQAELDDAYRKLEDVRCQLTQLGASDEERRVAQQKLQQEMQNAKEDAVNMVARLTKENQDKLTKLFEEHKHQLAQQKSSMLEKQAAELKTKLAECNRLHQEKLGALERKHASAINALDEQAKAAALEAKERLRLTETRWKEELEGERSVAENNDALLRKRIEESEKLLSDSNSRVATLENDFVELKKRHDLALAECKENYQSDVETQLGRHRVELEAINKRHAAEMGDLMNQFDEARTLQNQQIEMVHERLRELQGLYDSRPSRPEDLDVINSLEIDVREKEAAFKQLFDQMQFYKLELVNREQNYNKTFGANPSVGVLNPMAKKNGQVRIVQAQQALPPLGTNGINTKLKTKRPSSGGAQRNGIANGA